MLILCIPTQKGTVCEVTSIPVWPSPFTEKEPRRRVTVLILYPNTARRARSYSKSVEKQGKSYIPPRFSRRNSVFNLIVQGSQFLSNNQVKRFAAIARNLRQLFKPFPNWSRQQVTGAHISDCIMYRELITHNLNTELRRPERRGRWDFPWLLRTLNNSCRSCGPRRAAVTDQWPSVIVLFQ